MEGKSVIVCVLLISLTMSQFQVEAKTCCRTPTARNIYNTCRYAGGSRKMCAKLSGCHIVVGPCPVGCNHVTLQSHGEAVNEYCKLGCASSVCGALSTLRNSDSNEVVSGVVEQCASACATFCTKGFTASITAVEI